MSTNNNIKEDILSGLDDLILKSKNHQFELDKILQSSILILFLSRVV